MSRILDLARWAPSGDNTQPWRFEVRGPHHLVVHGRDTRDHCVYDLRGHASQIALGALLETISIAATAEGLAAAITRRPEAPETAPVFDIHFSPAPAVQPDPLIDWVPKRVTQRRPMKTRPLTPTERQELARGLPPGYRVLWIDGFSARFAIARLLFANAHIRLTTYEAYLVHKEVIEWRAQFSEDRIPDQAVGTDPLATRLMQWAMQSWGRIRFMNRYLAGTLLPRVQLDLLPALRCGAHFLLLAEQPARELDDYLAAGRAVQRFWLTAAKLGLQFQPEMTPLIFASYVREQVRFSESGHAWTAAQRLTARMEDLLGADACRHAVFMGRIGAGKAPKARSVRPAIEKLVLARD